MTSALFFYFSKMSWRGWNTLSGSRTDIWYNIVLSELLSIKFGPFITVLNPITNQASVCGWALLRDDDGNGLSPPLSCPGTRCSLSPPTAPAPRLTEKSTSCPLSASSSTRSSVTHSPRPACLEAWLTVSVALCSSSCLSQAVPPPPPPPSPAVVLSLLGSLYLYKDSVSRQSRRGLEYTPPPSNTSTHTPLERFPP